MNITVNTKELKQAVTIAKIATCDRAIQPILSNVKLSYQSNVLLLEATDLEFSVSLQIKATDQGYDSNNTLTVKCKDICNALKTVTTATVDLCFSEDTLSIDGMTINSLPADQFPLFPKPEVFYNSTVTIKSFEQVLIACASYEAHNVLGGINIQKRHRLDMIELAATDGSRLHYTKEDSFNDELFNITVPGESVSRILKACKTLKLHSENCLKLAVKLSDERTDYQGNPIERIVDSIFVEPMESMGITVKFWSRVMTGQYPMYHQLIPYNLPQKVEMDRAQLITSITKASRLSNPRTNLVKMEFKAHEVLMKGNTIDAGTSESRQVYLHPIDCDLTTGFNYRFFLDGLNSLNCKGVQVSFKEELTPFIISSNTENLIVLIMPIQIKDAERTPLQHAS